MHLKYTASATWREGETLLLLADARSGWSVIRWREGVTCAVTGWCAQWAGFHQPVSEAVIFPQFHLLSASQAVSSAPGELWCGGATDSLQHRDTQMRGRERYTTVPWEETLTAVFLPRNRTTAVLDGFHGECIPLDVNIIIILQQLIYFEVELMHYAR